MNRRLPNSEENPKPAGRQPKAIILANPRELLPWLPFLSAGPILGLIAMLAYGFGLGKATVIAVGLMAAGGAFGVSALLGFLFGVPRALTGTHEGPVKAGGSGFQSNSNLEQISDWLTKILVGVGLVQIGQLAHTAARLVRFLAPALGNKPSSKAFAAGLLVLYTTTGFMTGYVVTRVFLGPVFSRTEHLLETDGQLTPTPHDPAASREDSAGRRES